MLRRLAFISFMATTTFALDKQGSAHGGAVGGNDTSFNFSGALMAGGRSTTRATRRAPTTPASRCSGTPHTSTSTSSAGT